MLDASEIAVCDQFLTPWNGDYHNRLYGLLADLLEKAGWSCERTRQASIKGHHSLVEQYADGIENIEAKADRFAITVSQAVLEHVRDHQVAFANLYRITKPKGWGFHQVDFRDHRDFSKPLRLASLSFGEFQRLFAVSHGECGTWYSPAEMAKMIEEAGFSVTTIANGSAKPEQVAAIMTKIPPERKLSENDIAVTSALFSIRK